MRERYSKRDMERHRRKGSRIGERGVELYLSESIIEWSIVLPLQ